MSSEIRLRANGMEFRVLVAGPPAGAPVLLLHGFPESAESWRGPIASLAAEGRRVYAPDLRGYGGTDAPEGVEAYAMARLVDDVRGLFDALDIERADLVGHDWGALLGWPFVSRHQDRVRTWTSLSIAHPDALAEAWGYSGDRADPDQVQRSQYVEVFRRPGDAEAILAAHDYSALRNMYRLGPNPEAFPADVVDHLVASLARPGRLTAALNYYRANLHPEAFRDYPPCPVPIAVPTTLIWGTEDPALGRRPVEETARHMAGPYRLAEIGGAGHWLVFERPEEVTRLIVDGVGSSQT